MPLAAKSPKPSWLLWLNTGLLPLIIAGFFMGMAHARAGRGYSADFTEAGALAALLAMGSAGANTGLGIWCLLRKRYWLAAACLVLIPVYLALTVFLLWGSNWQKISG